MQKINLDFNLKLQFYQDAKMLILELESMLEVIILTMILQICLIILWKITTAINHKISISVIWITQNCMHHHLNHQMQQ